MGASLGSQRDRTLLGPSLRLPRIHFGPKLAVIKWLEIHDGSQLLAKHLKVGIVRDLAESDRVVDFKNHNSLRTLLKNAQLLKAIPLAERSQGIPARRHQLGERFFQTGGNGLGDCNPHMCSSVLLD